MGARGTTGYVLGRGAGSAAANWWEAGGATNCVAAYQPKGAASLAASYINLANPGTYNAAPGVAPTWDVAGGWAFDGTAYLLSGVVPAANYSMILRYSNWALLGGQNVLSGMYQDSARRFAFNLQSTGTGFDNGGTVTAAGTPLAAAVVAVTPAAAYRNGVNVGAIVGAWSGTTTLQCYIGARNVANARNFPSNVRIQAVAIYSATLSAAQVAAVTAAMNLL